MNETDKKRLAKQKERVVKKAVANALGIIRRDLDVVAVKPEGDEFTLSRSTNYNNVWDDANSALDEYVDTQNNTTPVEIDDDVLLIFTDGGSRGNPGPSASGYVILDSSQQILDEGGEYLGITTNNQAEYQAVKLALEVAQKYGDSKELQFSIDSLLVVNQLNGKWKVKNNDLVPVYQAIKDLSKSFKKVTFKHVRREFNKQADAKVNEVLDSREQNERSF